MMKKLTKAIFTIFLVSIFSFSTFGKSVQEIEMELVEHIKNIKAWSSYTNKYSEDLSNKLVKENQIFSKKLLKYTSEYPSTLKYDFPKLSKHMFIATSDDKNFRVYSWDKETGGTMHFYESVYQFKGNNKQVVSKTFDYDEGDPKSFVYDVFTLKTKKGKIYLTCNTSILSTSLNYQSINLMKIQGNELKDAKVIKTSSRITNEIGFQYNFFSVVDRPTRPIKLFKFNQSAKTIEFPVIIENKKLPYGKVTKKQIIYKFNGKYFVKIGYRNS